MKKKRRIWAYLGIGVTIFVVVLFLLASREHPDYVRAAKGLPKARQEAEEMFGHLNWNDWRAENGIDPEADLELGQLAVDSIPVAVKAQTGTASPSATSREVFLAEREWFERIDELVDGLKVRHVIDETGEEWDFSYLVLFKDIGKACHVGIMGAAEEGDAAAVLRLGRAGNKLNAAIETEPSMINVLVSIAIRAIIDSAMLRAAVRNRSNSEVIASVLTVLEERPQISSIREIMAADARLTNLYLEKLRTLRPGEIDAWLNSWEDYDYVSAMMGDTRRKLYDWWEGLTGEAPEFKRKTGKRTALALEARFWQVATEFTDIFERIERNETGAKQELNSIDARLQSGKDRSYEFAYLTHSSLFIRPYLRMKFQNHAMRTAIGLIETYPEYSAVPSSLPEDLSFADPFGGEPVLYKKTSTGFLIYTRYINGKDDGFPPQSPDQLELRSGSYSSINMLDWGLIVTYSPTDPRP